LPMISDQKYNDYLKDAAEAAGIADQVRMVRRSGEKEIILEGPKHAFISSHTARRTAITLLLQMGVPAATVMKITGHRKLDTLMKYENMADAAVIMELRRVGRLV